MKIFKKNTKLSLGLIAIIVLCSTALLGVIAAVTDGFQDFEFRQVNEDNLICVDNYEAALEDKRTDGLKVEVNDDGVIAITGENETENDVEIEICTVTLKADEYTLSCEGARGLDDKTYYLKAVNDSDDSTVIVDSNKAETFKVESDSTYTIYIVVCDGEEINTTFKPVLVADDEPGDFYVFSNK